MLSIEVKICCVEWKLLMLAAGETMPGELPADEFIKEPMATLFEEKKGRCLCEFLFTGTPNLFRAARVV